MFWIPNGGGLGLSLYSGAARELEVAAALRRLLAERSGVVVDVGANVGQSLLRVKGIEGKRPYLGIEPLPSCCAFLEKVAALNGLEEVNVICCALGAVPDISPLGIRGGSLEVSSVASRFRPREFYDRYCWVPVLDGDSLLARLGVDEVAVIKIDVEGSELEVIQGLAKTIARHRPPILFEILPDRILLTGQTLPEELVRVRRDRATEIENLLVEYGYSIARIGDGGVLHPVNMLAAQRNDSLHSFNYLAAAR